MDTRQEKGITTGGAMPGFQIETPRLLLRPMVPADAPEVYRYRSDAATNKYQGWIPSSLADVLEFIHRLASELDTAGSWFQFVIVQKESKAIIGDLGVHFHATAPRQVEIGCTMAKDHQQMGYATESIKAILGFIFNTLNKEQVFAAADPRNSGAIALLERLGFMRETPDKNSSTVQSQPMDDVIYVLRKGEWKATE